MVYVQTIVRVSDNSGGFLAMCIGILSQSPEAVVGDTLVISIKSILLNRKLTHQKKKKNSKRGGL